MSQPNDRPGHPGIPNGWFAVAWSKDVLTGQVERIRYFDQEMVLFRTRSGAAKVLDAYCAHLGAHLAEGGRVMDETVRCPFHAWQYDGDGRVTHIPYCKKIPPRARVRAWPVDERNGMIFVWHHAEGKPPDWQVPDLPELNDPEWTEPRPFELKVPVHLQEMAENNCDPTHFYYVHGSPSIPPTDMTYGEDGRFFRVNSRGPKETPFGTFDMDLERDTWGMGLSSVRMKGIPGAGLFMFSSTSPVDAGNAHSRWLFTTTRNMADVAGEEFIDGMSRGVLQDMRIWENKIYRHDPVLCEADEYLAEFRKWSKQFYSPRPDAG
jgi:nitrite reductase/ring-hydroxylating ferredoxin subunit